METSADRINRYAAIEAMPRIKFICGSKDWSYSRSCYAFGVVWDKNPAPEEGTYIYRRRFIFYLTFRLSLERN